MSVFPFHRIDRVGKMQSVKADLFIYSNTVTVSRQCLSVAIILNKFQFLYTHGQLPKSSHIYRRLMIKLFIILKDSLEPLCQSCFYSKPYGI